MGHSCLRSGSSSYTTVYPWGVHATTVHSKYLRNCTFSPVSASWPPLPLILSPTCMVCFGWALASGGALLRRFWLGLMAKRVSILLRFGALLLDLVELVPPCLVASTGAEYGPSLEVFCSLLVVPCALSRAIFSARLDSCFFLGFFLGGSATSSILLGRIGRSTSSARRASASAPASGRRLFISAFFRSYSQTLIKHDCNASTDSQVSSRWL